MEVVRAHEAKSSMPSVIQLNGKKDDQLPNIVRILNWKNGSICNIKQEKSSEWEELGDTAEEIIKKNGCNIDKINTTNDNKSHLNMITSKNIFQTSAIRSSGAESKPVFVIKNLSGKTVKLVPKSVRKLGASDIRACAPEVLSVPIDRHVTELAESAVDEKPFDDTENNKIELKNSTGFLINQNNASKLKISVLNSIDKSTLEKNMMFNVPANVPRIKVVPNPFRVLQNSSSASSLATVNASANTKPARVPISAKPVLKDKQDSKISVSERGTQTEGSVVRTVGIQTDPFLYDCDNLPDISQLVSYLLDKPEYSTGIEEGKKINLIDMSKTISGKGKDISTPAKHHATTPSVDTTKDQLKVQLFMDLSNCVSFDSMGNMPIHNAIMEDNLKALRKQCFVLKIRNRDVNIESNHGYTPLQMALLNNSSTEMISELLHCGANCNVIDKDGNSVLHLAVLHSNPDVMKIIIKQCNTSTADLKNDEGLTALMLACINNKLAMAEILLQNGADPNITDEKSGRTAFFHAVENEAQEITQLLVKYDANPKIRNFLGLTALEAVKDTELVTMTLVEDTRGGMKYKTSHLLDEDDEEDVDSPKAMDLRKRRSKLNFITSLKRVEMETVQNSSRKKRKLSGNTRSGGKS